MKKKSIKCLIGLSTGLVGLTAMPFATLVSCSSSNIFDISVDGSNKMEIGFATDSSLSFFYKHNDNKYAKVDKFKEIKIVNPSESISHDFRIVGWDDIQDDKAKVYFKMEALGEWSLKFDLKFTCELSLIDSGQTETKTVEYTVGGLEMIHHQRANIGKIKLIDGCSPQQIINISADKNKRYATFKFQLVDYEFPATNVANVSIEEYGATPHNISLVDAETLPIGQPTDPIPAELKKDKAQIYLGGEVQNLHFNLFVAFKDDTLEPSAIQTIKSLKFEMQDGRIYTFSNPQGAISIKSSTN